MSFLQRHTPLHHLSLLAQKVIRYKNAGPHGNARNKHLGIWGTFSTPCKSRFRHAWCMSKLVPFWHLVVVLDCIFAKKSPTSHTYFKNWPSKPVTTRMTLWYYIFLGSAILNLTFMAARVFGGWAGRSNVSQLRKVCKNYLQKHFNKDEMMWDVTAQNLTCPLERDHMIKRKNHVPNINFRAMCLF